MSQDPKKSAELSAQRAAAAQETYGKTQELDPAFIMQCLDDNETGDRRLIIMALKDRFIYDAKRGRWFIFRNGYWQTDFKEEYKIAAQVALTEAYGKEADRQASLAHSPDTDAGSRKTAAAKYADLTRRLKQINSLRRLNSITDFARTGKNDLVIFGDEWNRQPWTLQAQNQLIDLKTGEARTSFPQDYINRASPTEWTGIDTPAPTWETFLDATFAGNKKIVAYLQKALGLALVGKVIKHELYIFYGVGRNGKGTMLETLKEVLGEDLASSINSDLIMQSGKPSNGPNPEILNLQGKRLVWTSETGENCRINSEKVKMLTGGDTISGIYKFSNDTITFEPTHTLIILTNYKPRISGSDVAMWDRVRLIPFTERFVPQPQKENEHPQDPELKDKLLAEKSGILAWLVRGCMLFLADGLNPPPDVIEAGADYREEEDTVMQFINENCTQDENGKTMAKELY